MNELDHPANQTDPSSPDQPKKGSSTIWIVIGVIGLLSLFSDRGPDRGDEAAADAKFQEWVSGTVDHTWAGR